jgi:hypothetical protein
MHFGLVHARKALDAVEQLETLFSMMEIDPASFTPSYEHIHESRRQTAGHEFIHQHKRGNAELRWTYSYFNEIDEPNDTVSLMIELTINGESDNGEEHTAVYYPESDRWTIKSHDEAFRQKPPEQRLVEAALKSEVTKDEAHQVITKMCERFLQIPVTDQ